jgi:hypothetical protein
MDSKAKSCDWTDTLAWVCVGLRGRLLQDNTGTLLLFILILQSLDYAFACSVFTLDLAIFSLVRNFIPILCWTLSSSQNGVYIKYTSDN